MVIAWQRGHSLIMCILPCIVKLKRVPTFCVLADFFFRTLAANSCLLFFSWFFCLFVFLLLFWGVNFQMDLLSVAESLYLLKTICMLLISICLKELCFKKCALPNAQKRSKLKILNFRSGLFLLFYYRLTDVTLNSHWRLFFFFFFCSMLTCPRYTVYTYPHPHPAMLEITENLATVILLQNVHMDRKQAEKIRAILGTGSNILSLVVFLKVWTWMNYKVLKHSFTLK